MFYLSSCRAGVVGEKVDEPGPEGDVGMTDHHHPHPGPGRGGHPVIIRKKLIVMYKNKLLHRLPYSLYKQEQRQVV